jgi:hypothetical protein
MTQDLDDILHQDAATKKIGVNTLLSSILTKYAEWDRFEEKYGFMHLTRELFKIVLQTVDEEKLMRISKEFYGGGGPKEFLTFRSKRINIETALEHISAACKYAGLAQCDIALQGKEYILTIHHELGQKWSEYLAFIWGQGLMKTTLGLPVEYEVTKNSIVIRFSKQ